MVKISPLSGEFPNFLLLALLISAVHNTQQQQKSLAEQNADLGSLRFVHAIWRHGDRTPSKMMPSDAINGIEKWQEKFGGLGQLTQKGAFQHFRLGKMLRRRYRHFLPRKYNPDVFVNRSSDFNRTKMSAIANVQGMFAPRHQHSPKVPLAENVPNGFVPQFMPKDHDPYVFDDVQCLEATKAEDAIFNGNAVFKSAEKENEPFLQFLREKSGFMDLRLRQIYYVHDPLTSIYSHLNDGFSLPEWANQSVRAEVFRLYNLKNSFDFKSDSIIRFWSGPLFTEIIQRMKNISSSYGAREEEDNDSGYGEGEQRIVDCGNGERFHAYSGHDLTIAGMLALFGIFPETFPTFANALLIELHESAAANGGEPFVRLFHKDQTDGTQLWEYEIPECGKPCTLRRLEQIKRQFMINLNQWCQECHQENGQRIIQ